MILTVLAEAEAELRSAFAYLNDQAPGLGVRIFDEVADAFQAISITLELCQAGNPAGERGVSAGLVADVSLRGRL